MEIQTLVNAYKEKNKGKEFYDSLGNKLNDEGVLTEEMAYLSLDELVELIEENLDCEVHAYYDENDGDHGSLVDQEFTKKIKEMAENEPPDDPYTESDELWDAYLDENNLKELDELFTDKDEFFGASDPIFGYRLYVKVE